MRVDMSLQVGAEAERVRPAWLRDAAREELADPVTPPRRISVFGLGNTGVVSLACLGRDGHEMTAVDVDARKLELLRSGQAPIVETGIQELMRAVARSGSLTVTDRVADAVMATDISFVCVRVPVRRNGSQDLGAITRIAGQIGAVLPQKTSRHIIVIRSTVKPGTVDEVVRPAIETSSGLIAGRDFSLCFQPEFLRRGTSINDYDNPPLTIVGTDEESAADVLRAIFGHLPCEFVHTSIRTAEMLKYACNAFHAMKVTFANEIGRVSQAAGVDPHDVMKLLCMDRQLNVSSAYLHPGFAFGGSSLPEDLKALLCLAREHEVELPMLASILPSNVAHVEHAIECVLARNPRRVGMLGLSFKAGTADLRESPLVVMAERFIGKGLQLRVFEPDVHAGRAAGAARSFIEESIPHIAALMTGDLDSLVRDCDVLIVAVKTAEVLAALEKHTRPDQMLLDVAALADRDAFRAGYQGVCW